MPDISGLSHLYGSNEAIEKYYYMLILPLINLHSKTNGSYGSFCPLTFKLAYQKAAVQKYAQL